MSLSDRIRPNVEAAQWVIDEVRELEAENKEQARLLGMSGEREAALLAEVAQWKAVKDILQKEIMEMGKVIARVISENAKLREALK